jgi:hypothetical protein
MAASFLSNNVQPLNPMNKEHAPINTKCCKWTLCLFAFAVLSSHADEPKLDLSINGTSIDLSWATELDTYYFIQQSETLVSGSWEYLNFATVGDGSNAFTFTDGSPSKQFFRLEFYPTNISPLPAVLTANFDGDLADNKTELDQGTDLFGLTFSDADSLFDEWEFAFFGDLSQGDAGNDDADFTSNLEESQLGLDPTVDERSSAVTYTYDPVGRLTSASSDALSLIYTLDAEGNILSKN